MSDPLYKRELLRLAADATCAGRLAHVHGTGIAYNPACGDKVTVDIQVQDRRVTGIAHDTKACVLTQASATIVGSEIVGLSRVEIVELRESVIAMLEGGATPPSPFDVYGVFDGVIDHRSRHKCVLLPIDAVLAAFDALEIGEPGG